MPWSKYVLATFLIVFSIYCPGMGQSQIRDTLIHVLPGQVYLFETSQAESVAITCSSCSFRGAYFLAGQDTIPVAMDPHADHSAFVMLGNTPQPVTFYSGDIAAPLRFYFIQTGSVVARQEGTARIYADDCEINAVLPREWRQGLPAPAVKPTRTDTRHIIIHHSATANTITDPYLAVRSIYSYHTQVNGWDDIGYNYLIAPDGTIFQGRDDQGLFEGDYVLGAHMCGVNAGTIGICMLGTFSGTLPTRQALQALYRLIKWKAEKDNISISGSTLHAIGPPSSGNQLLAHVGGHRDGCRAGYTECPGNALYQQIPAIRQAAANLDCAGSATEPQVMVYPNPARDQIRVNFPWQKLHIYDIQGKLIRSSTYQNKEFISLNGLSRGMYLFYFYTTALEYKVEKISIM